MFHDVFKEFTVSLLFDVETVSSTEHANDFGQGVGSTRYVTL